MNVLKVVRRMHRAAREIVALVERAAAAEGLSAAELDVLSVLLERGPAPVSEVLGEGDYKPSTLTSILDRLAARGWITREVRADDRRSFVVALTGEGRRAARALQTRLAPLEREMARRIPKADVEAVLRLPARLDALRRTGDAS
jgi:DNA-binding MarR family transcriptional regulator